MYRQNKTSLMYCKNLFFSLAPQQVHLVTCPSVLRFHSCLRGPIIFCWKTLTLIWSFTLVSVFNPIWIKFTGWIGMLHAMGVLVRITTQIDYAALVL